MHCGRCPPVTRRESPAIQAAVSRPQPFALLLCTIGSHPMTFVFCPDNEIPRNIAFFRHMGRCLIRRDKTAGHTSSSEEVQRLLILNADLEQYTQHARESTNCLNPRTAAPRGCGRELEMRRLTCVLCCEPRGRILVGQTETVAQGKPMTPNPAG